MKEAIVNAFEKIIACEPYRDCWIFDRDLVRIIRLEYSVPHFVEFTHDDLNSSLSSGDLQYNNKAITADDKACNGGRVYIRNHSAFEDEKTRNCFFYYVATDKDSSPRPDKVCRNAKHWSEVNRFVPSINTNPRCDISSQEKRELLRNLLVTGRADHRITQRLMRDAKSSSVLANQQDFADNTLMQPLFAQEVGPDQSLSNKPIAGLRSHRAAQRQRMKSSLELASKADTTRRAVTIGYGSKRSLGLGLVVFVIGSFLLVADFFSNACGFTQVTSTQNKTQHDIPSITDSPFLSRGPPAPPYPLTLPNDICNASRSDFRSASGLFAIVTGCEHSGTTLMSQLIMSVPNLYGGFECGLLLATTPARFDRKIEDRVGPFDKFMITKWQLRTDQRDFLRRSQCHAEMYAQLRTMSPLYHVPNNESWVVDKTPRYSDHLTEIMDRTPGVPVIVTRKPKEDQLKSFLKRDPNATEKFLKRLDRVNAVLSDAMQKYPDRIHVVDMEEFATDVDGTMTKVFDFLGLQWVPEYTDLQSFNVKGEPMGVELQIPVQGPLDRDRVFSARSRTDEKSE